MFQPSPGADKCIENLCIRSKGLDNTDDTCGHLLSAACPGGGI